MADYSDVVRKIQQRDRSAGFWTPELAGGHDPEIAARVDRMRDVVRKIQQRDRSAGFWTPELAGGHDPEIAARADRMRRKTGRPVMPDAESVTQAEREFEQQQARDALDSHGPRTREWLAADPVNAQISDGDVERLTAIERLVNREWDDGEKPSGIGEALGRAGRVGGYRLGENVTGAVQAQGEFTSEGYDAVLSAVEQARSTGDVTPFHRLGNPGKGRGAALPLSMQSMARDVARGKSGALDDFAQAAQEARDEARASAAAAGAAGEHFAALSAAREAESGLKHGTFPWYVSKITESLIADMLPAMGVAVATGGAGLAAGVSQTAGLTTMFAGVYGGEYGRNRREGLSRDESSNRAAISALTEVGTEIVPFGMALGPARNIITRMFKTGGAEGLSEVLAETINMGIDAGRYDETTPWHDTVNDDGTITHGVWTRVMDSFVIGGGMGVAMSVPGAAANVGADMRRRSEARDRQAAFTALGEQVADSKTLERVPERFRAFVEQATKDGPVEDVYIDARQFREYWQTAGVTAEQLELEFPELADQREELAGDGDVRLSLATYATKVAPTDHHFGLMPHLRTAPEQVSMFEAEQQGAVFAEEMQAEIAAAAEVSADAEQVEFDLEEVRGDVYDQLIAAGRAPHLAQQEADVWREFFRTFVAERAGKDPLEAYRAYRSQFLGPGQRAVREAVTSSRTLAQSERGQDDGTGPGPGLRADEDVARDLGGGRPARGWAGSTRIRRRGRPALVYRASRNGLRPENFDQLGAATGHPSAGLGVFFTNTEADAAQYGPSVESFHVDMRNPAVYRLETLPGFDTVEDAVAFRESLMARGHDGIIVKGKHLGGPTHIVAFDPQQVIVGGREFDQGALPSAAEPRFNELGDERRVSTRVPTAKRGAIGNVGDNATVVELDVALENAPAWVEKVAGLLRQPYGHTGRRGLVGLEGYPVRDISDDMSDEEVIEAAVEHFKDNLLWLHGMVPEEIRERSRLWYDGAHRVSVELAARYGIDEAPVAGVIASLSPQKDWFQNASLAERVLDTFMQRQDFAWTDEMAETLARVFGDEKYDVLRAEVEGRTLAEVGHDVGKAVWVRVFSQTYHSPGYNGVTPEGSLDLRPQTAAGNDASIQWGSNAEVARAIAILGDPSPDSIAAHLGMQHKVRSFYNNILDPAAPAGDVTIDTHAVAAAMLRPMSTASQEVVNNFSSPSDARLGLRGTYAMYAEAYRRAADSVNILPREMQSITWEAVRGLMTAEFKRTAAAPDVNEAWLRYYIGEQDIGQTRQDVVELAGGLTAPEWTNRPAVAVDEGPRGTSYESALPSAVVPGGRAAAAAGGDPGVTPGGAALAPLLAGREYDQDLIPPGAAPAAPFFSALERAIESVESKAMPAGQWRARLKNMPGVKAEEVEWVDLEGYLAEREGRVTKDELLEYVRAHGAKVEVVTKGGVADAEYRISPDDIVTQNERVVDGARLWDIGGFPSSLGEYVLTHLPIPGEPGVWGVYGAEDNAEVVDGLDNSRSALDSFVGYLNRTLGLDEEGAPSATYGEYVLPGGANYREVLVTLPDAASDREAFVETLAAKYGEGWSFDQLTAAENERFAEFQRRQFQGGDYTSPHFEEANILVHLRVDDRAVDDGKVLFVNEVQSDWMAEGRDKGFGTEAEILPNATAELLVDEVGGFKPRWEVRSEQGVVMGGYHASTAEAAVERARTDIRERQVPDAPFKNTWALLGMKQAIRMAVEGGYDFIAWPGSAAMVSEIEQGGGGEGNLYTKHLPRLMRGYVKKWKAKVERGPLLGALESEVDKEAEEDKSWNELARWVSSVVNYIEITPEMREAALAGQPLFQERRGSIQLPPGEVGSGATLINLFEEADASTVMHESAHFFLEVIRQVASQPGVPQAVLDDWATIQAYLGGGANGFTREQHEIWARSFEAYLLEGKAPSLELQSAFSRFRSWLLSLYKHVRNLNVPINDDIRGVFDRMLASDAAIETARDEHGLEPLFAEALAAGMSEAERTAYLRAVKRTNERERARLTAKALKSVTKQRTDAWKEEQKRTRAEVEAELSTLQVYRAVHWLQTGTAGDGDPLDDLGAVKLSRDALRDRYGPEILDELDRHGGGTRRVWQATGGAHPDVVAEVLGYDSGDALVQDITGAAPFADAVKAEVAERMKASDDMLSPGALEAAAAEVVHSAPRVALLERELVALQRAAGRPPLKPRQVARRMAERTLAGRTVALATRSGTFAQQERRAARATERALLKATPDYAEASAQKRQQLISHHLYAASRDVQAEVDRALKMAERLGRKGLRKRLAKKAPDYLEQIDDLLETYDFRRSTSLVTQERRERMQKFIKEREAAGEPVLIPEHVIEDSRRRSYKTLTVEEFRGVVDAILNLENLARNKSALVIAGERIELEAAVKEINESVRGNAKGEPRGIVEPRTIGEKRKDFWLGLRVAHRTMASLMRQLDGWKEGGVMYRYFIRPMDARSGWQADRREKSSQELHAILKDAGIFTTGQEMKQAFQAVTFEAVGGPKPRTMQRTSFGGGVGSLTKEAQLMVALNWGNEGNRVRLLNGYAAKGWTEEGVQEVLDNLEEGDWKFVQAIWDYLETFKAEAFAKQKRVTGVMPKEVEAVPVETKFGTFRGGYFPVRPDSKQGGRSMAEEHDEAISLAIGGTYVAEMTRHGHLKERQGDGAGLPLRLDFGVIFEHVEGVIHDLAWHEYLIDTGKLLNVRSVQDNIIDHYGSRVFQQFRDARRAIAGGEIPAMNAVDQAAVYLRNGVTISVMGFKLWTAVQQPLGLFAAVPRLGFKHALGGVLHFYTSPIDTTKAVHAQSVAMRTRHLTMTREIRQLEAKIDKGSLNVVQESFFYFTTKMQMLADMPIWLGAYAQAIEAGQTEENATLQADRVVKDTQGGGQIADMPAVSRGHPVAQIFTSFMTFFLATFNETAGVTGRANLKKPTDVIRLAMDYMMLYIVPATLTSLLSMALLEDGDDEDLPMKLAKDNLSYMMGTMVLVRELSSMLMGFDYQGPAGTRFWADITKFFAQAAQGEIDRPFIEALVRSTGTALHLPEAQVRKTVTGLMAASEGERNPVLGAMFGPERKSN